MKSTVILKASLIYFTVFIFSLYHSLLFLLNGALFYDLIIIYAEIVEQKVILFVVTKYT